MTGPSRALPGMAAAVDAVLALGGFSASDAEAVAAAAYPVIAKHRDPMIAAAALMGVVAEIDDFESAEVVTRRAIEFEREAARLTDGGSNE